MNKTPHQLLRLTHDERREILARLAENPARASEHDQREGSRIRTLPTHSKLLIRLRSSPGVEGAFWAIPKDLSTTGMAFLHGASVGEGTPCHASLGSSVGGELDLHGIVIRCTPVHGRVYEVGVRFLSPLAPSDLDRSFAPEDPGPQVLACPIDGGTWLRMSSLCASLIREAASARNVDEARRILKELDTLRARLDGVHA